MASIQEEAEAKKALSLDPLLPEAHWQLALVARVRGDEAEYRRREARVLQLNPNFAPAHQERASRLVLEGRFDEAVAEFRRTRALVSRQASGSTRDHRAHEAGEQSEPLHPEGMD